MNIAIAADACWLKSLDSADWDTQSALMGVFSDFGQGGVHLLVDAEGAITREYGILEFNSLGRKLIERANRENAVVQYSGRPRAKCASALRDDGFDPDDDPYIGVCQRGGGHYLTTEEKHLSSSRRELVASRCGVEIVTLEELAERCHG